MATWMSKMMVQSQASLNKEKTTTLMKHIQTKKKKYQEQNNDESFTVTMQEIKNLKMKVFELVESIQFTQSEQEGKVNGWRKNFKKHVKMRKTYDSDSRT